MISEILIARIAHEVNRAYCKSIGDYTQVAWECAPAWQRQSAVNGVLAVRDNPNASPSESHNSWLEEKRLAGWKYGEVKNEVAKEHPCFVKYGDLPKEQQAKDYIFTAIAKELLAI